MACYRPRLLSFLLLVAFALSGCSKTPAPAPAASDASPSAAPPTSAAAPATPAAMAAHAPTAPAATGTAVGVEATASGTIVETMDAGGYTYVHLDTGSEKIWAATSQTKVKVGQQLTVPLEMPMQNFHSPKLGRTFPLIYFASRVAHGGEPLPARAAGAAAMPAAQTMPAGHPQVGAGSASGPVTVTEVIPPAAGGQSVAGLWEKRATLAGKTVVVRGKVVKFLSGIMGKNWVHLQDGTGNAKDGTNDITVTTDATAKPGDLVTATGTLAVDKDFGAGYKYGAIVEGATLAK